MNELSFALWGLGKHAQRNLVPAIRAAAGIELAGIHTRSAERRAEWAGEYGCKDYATERSMLEDPDVDAVWIVTPNGLHPEHVGAALDAGKHVLVEKTAFPTAADALTAVELARTKRLVLMEGLMYRFHPQFAELSRLVREQEFGPALEVRATFGFPHLAADDIRYRADLGGGALNDAGAYPVSAARLLAGPEAAVAWAAADVADGYDVDTGGSAVISAPHDLTVYAAWRFGGSYSSEIRVWCEQAHLIAERAFAKPDSLATSVTAWANGKPERVVEIPPANHFVAMLERFAALVAAGDCESESRLLLEQARLMESVRSQAARS